MVVLHHDFFDALHGNVAHQSGFEGAGVGDVVLMGEVGAVAKEADGQDEAHDLTAVAGAHLIDFDLSRNEAEQIRGLLPLAVYQVVFFVIVEAQLVVKEVLFVFCQKRPKGREPFYNIVF